MPREACICRVGSLAVALGVGVAIMTGWSTGLAWADESGESPGSAVAGAEPASAKPSSGGTDPTTGELTTDLEVSSTPPGAVVGSDGLTDEASPPISTAPEATAADTSAGEEQPTAELGPSHRSDRRADNPIRTKTPNPASSFADDEDDAALTATAKTEDTLDPAERSRGASLPIAPTQSPTVTVQDAEPTAGSMPPMPRRPEGVDVVSRLISGVVSAILNPFAANSAPEAPVGAPSIWSLLAFARREFEKAFTAPSLTDTSVDTQTTSATLAEPEQRTLILSAFPAEADAILARTTLDPNPSVVVDGRHFYLGSIADKKVIVAMTGIGMENATDTTETALAHFTPESGISIGAVVFSGVAGGSGRTQIGSVAVPARWTSDDGATWHAVDSGMLAAANTLTVDLESTATLGDPLCLCSPLARLPLIDLNREPQLFVGGDGSSDDNNNGAAFPAIPLGGDIFGPQPCAAPDRSLLFTGNFFQALGPFLARGLLSNLTGLLAPVVPPVDAVDQETAAAQQVADAHGIPFLGIRGMSDGPGDPLNLPGYPFTFFVYKQIAADNAAIVTEAFLQGWDGA